MIYEIQIKVKVEAVSRREARKSIAQFIDDPRNPNLLPNGAKLQFVPDATLSDDPGAMSNRSFDKYGFRFRPVTDYYDWA